jgi:hypothetical protein
MEIIVRAFSIVSAGICFMMALFSFSACHTLMGSFFKKYYRFMTFSFVVVGAGLLIEGLEGFIGLSIEVTSLIHHILFLAGIIGAMAAGIGLPQEISRQFNGKVKSN